VHPQHTKCIPRQREQVNFYNIFLLGGGDLEVGVVHLVGLDRLLRATTEKKSSTFLEEKMHPRQNSGYDYIGSINYPYMPTNVIGAKPRF